MRDYVLTTKNIASYPGLLKVRYPKAGDLNPKVAILIYDLKSAKTLRVEIDGDERQYLYNVRWTPSGKELLINRTNRRQNKLDVIVVDPVSGKTRIVVSESQKTWQENSPLMRFLKDGKRFVWETEKNGWKNYELRHLNGKLLHRLSKETEASEVADEMYLAILCRQPSDDERHDLVTYLDQRGKDRGKAIREFAWSLLSSIEFRFNH